jgi:hypothetical protein
MRGVSLLIRLAQNGLEERRSDLGGICRAQEETEVAIEAHDETAESEARIAMADPTAMALFGAWASQSARGRARLQGRFEELDLSANAARESLCEAAAEVRRLEIVMDTVRARARRLSLRQADARADERELARHNELTSVIQSIPVTG